MASLSGFPGEMARTSTRAFQVITRMVWEAFWWSGVVGDLGFLTALYFAKQGWGSKACRSWGKDLDTGLWQSAASWGRWKRRAIEWGGLHSGESVALPLTYSLFGIVPHASGNTGENLVSAGSQPLAMYGVPGFRLSVFKGTLGYLFVESHSTSEKFLSTLPLFCSQQWWKSARIRLLQPGNVAVSKLKEKTLSCLVLSSLCFPPVPAACSAECWICFWTPCLMSLVYLYTRILIAV